MYAIIETDHNGEPLISDGCTFYLNHSCLGSMSFGSEDMAWTCDHRLEAEGMLAQVRRHKNSRLCEVIEIC